MKTATIRQVRHEWNAVLAWVAQGEEVTVLNRTRSVARICPPRPQAAAKLKLPDFADRARATFGTKRTYLSDAILKERKDTSW